jgi:two-component system cell cycle response regulator CtrA
LLARMRAIVRRTRGYSNSLLRAGAVTLDVEQQEVLANGNRVHFTGKEFAILQLLMLRKNIVLTKETILSQLYNGLDEPEIKIIDVFVCKIRNKLANAGIRNVICTVWGRGYTIRDTGRDNDTSAAPRIPQPVEVSRLSRAFA